MRAVVVVLSFFARVLFFFPAGLGLGQFSLETLTVRGFLFMSVRGSSDFEASMS